MSDGENRLEADEDQERVDLSFEVRATPYAILVSEVMLQQRQMARVVWRDEGEPVGAEQP